MLETQNNAILVKVWHLKLNYCDISPECFPFYQLLSQEEKNKSIQFKKLEDQICYVVSKAFLRLLIYHELGLCPNSLKLNISPTGKPYIDPFYNFHFNLSHSVNHILIAYSNNEVGVDIEKHHEINDIKELMKFTMSEREFKSWSTLFFNNFMTSFFKWWTLKEALLKCLGEGIAGESFKKIDIFPQKQNSEPVAYKIDKNKILLQPIELGCNQSAAIAVKTPLEEESLLSIQKREVESSFLIDFLTKQL